jgi:Fe-S-cluster containining protein
MTAGQNKCLRCGTCCLKGGPALHLDDKKLLSENTIKLEHLYTIRQGEPALTPFGSKPEFVQTEIIKLKGQTSQWSCLFYDRQDNSCLIYEQKPLECSLLKCWDTTELEAIVGMNLLKRTDLLYQTESLLKIIAFHEQECSYDNLGGLISSLSDKCLNNQLICGLWAGRSSKY